LSKVRLSWAAKSDLFQAQMDNFVQLCPYIISTYINKFVKAEIIIS
jgi:hypothetical protein